MKARGRYLLGIDFDAKEGPKVLAIPFKGPTPLWHAAESVTTEQIEKMLDRAERKPPPAKND